MCFLLFEILGFSATSGWFERAGEDFNLNCRADVEMFSDVKVKLVFDFSVAMLGMSQMKYKEVLQGQSPKPNALTF